MDVLKIVEFVGFDILFLGIIGLAVLLAAGALWFGTPLVRIVSSKPVSDLLDPQPKGAVVLLASAAVVCAAALGMVLNLTADEMLDADSVTSVGCALPNGLWPEHVRSEDTIKRLALVRVLQRKSQFDTYNTKGLLESLEQPSNKESKKKNCGDACVSGCSGSEHAAQAFYQHGMALMAQRDSRAAVTLQSEFVVIKVLRVLWLGTIALALVGLAATARAYRRKRGSQEPRRIKEVAIPSALLAMASFVFLWLWGEQSWRYYLKSAYLFAPNIVSAKSAKESDTKESAAQKPFAKGVTAKP